MTRPLSAREKIDEDAEHYCAIHSPPRRKKLVQDKVKTGFEKINSLKKIEENKDKAAKYGDLITQKQQVRLQRSASERIANRNPSTLLIKKDLKQQQRSANDGASNSSLSKKITINSEANEEKKKFSKDSSIKTNPDIKTNSPSPSMSRRSVIPK